MKIYFYECRAIRSGPDSAISEMQPLLETYFSKIMICYDPSTHTLITTTNLSDFPDKYKFLWLKNPKKVCQSFDLETATYRDEVFSHFSLLEEYSDLTTPFFISKDNPPITLNHDGLLAYLIQIKNPQPVDSGSSCWIYQITHNDFSEDLSKITQIFQNSTSTLIFRNFILVTMLGLNSPQIHDTDAWYVDQPPGYIVSKTDYAIPRQIPDTFPDHWLPAYYRKARLKNQFVSRIQLFITYRQVMLVTNLLTRAGTKRERE